MEKGRRHQCVYDTGYGEMMIGVLGNQISSTLTDKGGNIQFKYSLDINTSLASENEVYILSLIHIWTLRSGKLPGVPAFLMKGGLFHG